jgi:hypothetical protein
MPFQGVNSYLWTLTRRVAAGWFILPFQGIGQVGYRRHNRSAKGFHPTIAYLLFCCVSFS